MKLLIILSFAVCWWYANSDTCENSWHSDTMCKKWKKAKGCQIEEASLAVCQKTCNLCAKTPATQKVDDLCKDTHNMCKNWFDGGFCDRNNEKNREKMKKECKQTCGYCSPDFCKDTHNMCQTWLKKGLCKKADEKNRNFLKKECTWSCGYCTQAVCEDTHKGPYSCEQRRDFGECDSQTKAEWMLKNCRKSCHNCMLEPGTKDALDFLSFIKNGRIVVGSSD